MRSDEFISLKNTSKFFGQVKALKNINLTFNKGEVHCLAGKNGCGKSTLFKIISGVHNPEPGSEIILNGKSYTKLNPQLSIENGIQVIYQDLSLFPNLSVAENIAIQNHLAWTKGLVSKKNMDTIALEAMHKVGVSLPLTKLVEKLSIAECQLVAICRAMASDAKLVIMDEPTASLTRTEVNNLIKVVKDLKGKGITVVFVSHKLDEVMEISDRITVIRDGKTIGTYPAQDVDSNELGFLMTGQRFNHTPIGKYSAGGVIKFEAVNLNKKGQFNNINLKVHAGEIVSLTGLLGSGRTELCLALFGMVSIDSGEIRVNDKSVSLQSNRDAIKNGIGYVSEDRMSTGLIMEQSIQSNTTVSILPKLKKKSGLFDYIKAGKIVERLISSLSIKVSDSTLPMTSLSGGNAQRISIAKWIAAEPEILILDSPTVGVDIANKESIYTIIQDLAKTGIAIIMVSDEIPEVFYNSHRVLVMKSGEITHEFYPESSSEIEIMEAVNA